MGSLAGRVALVTGAGRGIGLETAVRLAAEDARVVLVARTATDVEQAARSIVNAGGEALAIPGDVTDAAFVACLFTSVRERYGRLDLLVNCAGIAPFGTVEEADPARLRACLEVNIVGVFLCIQQAVRLMHETGDTGKILTVGSVRSRWSEQGDCGFYNASKYGVYGLVESIARQLHGSGSQIACGLINPGVVDTPLTNPRGEPRPGWLRPEQVAEAILHAATAPAGVNTFETVLFSTTQRPW